MFAYGVLAAPATAANIVYTKDRNVFVTSPDGSVKRQITRNGAVNNAYRSPSEKADGTIVVPHSSKFWFLYKLDGRSAGGPWKAFKMNSCSTSPIYSQVTPTGNLIVYTFIYADICLGGGQAPRLMTTFANANSPTAAGIYPEYFDYTEPRWIPGTSFAAMMNDDGTRIAAQNGASLVEFLQTDAGEEFQSFDFAPNGRDMAIVTSAPGATSGPATLSVWRHNSRPPGDGTGSPGCVSPNAVSVDSDVRWSPDGTMITWATSQGVWVSPAPRGAPGASCSLSPKLIAPGGEDPDWGAKDLPSPPKPPPPPRPPVIPPTTDVTRPAITSRAAGRQRLRRALAKGLRWSVTTNEPGVARVTAKVGTRTVARGTRSLAGAGRHRVTLKFTKKARKQLKRRRRIKLKITTVVTDQAGNSARSTAKLTLKR